MFSDNRLDNNKKDFTQFLNYGGKSGFLIERRRKDKAGLEKDLGCSQHANG